MGHRLSENEVEQVLEKGTYMTVGFISEEGLPQTAALTYVWDNQKKAAFIHGSKQSSLMKLVQQQSVLSGTVVVDTAVDAPEFTLRYRSVNMIGALTTEPPENLEHDMEILCAKYLGPDFPSDHFARTMGNLGDVLIIFKLTPNSLTGRGHDMPTI
ncbi:pyridoxamine 5'-phosphate oxidase family protein [Secundilactobacillus malefermentans]|uniref:Pyridoxamine 5'-phosphate oxidase putative domain-containing protein n=1 Tax=Secundilactobacillus malefermentans TaxID=176292 RepID=A0A4R5NR78_9LACO|nr:pyridoxamine 5'-phosphate oxidase family protein [Secundilactobacillus malefermentans]KRM57710.1 pyridoxamine 5-phosphate oxidase-related fmn-binding protein [Secundilactobacillus malefermentans DSM 5705 = KCTC 3548]QEA32103.1 pyridoxamine 5'-phosphate oxidase family protein [Secundilactobacillus malefermentans]TDG78851.1 hypothetical protein C5L31_000511 [Secundilactobacillus malefermentans]